MEDLILNEGTGIYEVLPKEVAQFDCLWDETIADNGLAKRSCAVGHAVLAVVVQS